MLAATTLALLAGQGQKQPSPSADFSKRPAPPVSAEARRELEAKLSEARTRYEAEPNNPDALIWFGRRLGYLGRFTEAIEAYTTGIRKFPAMLAFTAIAVTVTSPTKFDLAIADFQKAVSLIKVCR